MGRKRIDPDLKKVPYTFSVSQGDLQILREKAKEEGIAVSTILESLIKKYIG